jgi:TRAP-type uncharacterized transport system substrate-binding protein
VKPGPGRTGVEQPTRILVYDYALWANAKVPEDTVAKVAQALHDHPADLKATSPLWAEYDVKELGRDVGVPYHPGAVKVYQAKGIWKK